MSNPRVQARAGRIVGGLAVKVATRAAMAVLARGRASLRFPLGEVQTWAFAYDYGGDDRMADIGRAAKARGYLTRAEFLEMVEWKSAGRQKGNAAKNTAEAIRDATAPMFTTAPDDRTWMEALESLQGVGKPTASVLRHFSREDVPILDRRALQALGIDDPPTSYSMPFWEAFADTCTRLAEEAHVTPRVLDRALWAWSKARGTPLA